MPVLTSERREKKQGKIRNSEYYGMESIFDTLYAESRNGKTFNHLMAIIESEENIKLAYGKYGHLVFGIRNCCAL